MKLVWPLQAREMADTCSDGDMTGHLSFTGVRSFVHVSAISFTGMNLNMPVQACTGQGVAHKTSAWSMAMTVRH